MMVVDAAVSWSEVAAVVYGLVLEGRETESGPRPNRSVRTGRQSGGRHRRRGRHPGSAVAGAGVFEAAAARRPGAGGDNPGTTDTGTAARIVRGPRRIRPPGGLRRTAVRPRGRRTRHDRAHGGGGALGTRTHGSVWVACSAPLDGAALTALADGARTVALHLLRSRASADLERQVESELVIRLLEGTADAATVASRLGLPHSRLRVIALQAFIGADRDAALLLAFERATTGFGWSRPGRSALAGNTVYTAASRRAGGDGAALGHRSAGGPT